MEYFGNPGSLKLLQELLKEPERDSSDSEPDDRVPNFSTKITAPSTSALDPSQKPTNESNEPNKSSNGPSSFHRFQNGVENTAQTFSEWQEQEESLNDELETRRAPEYRIVYKQSVTPSDIYLQMGNKTPATSSCEEMCLEILMPNETVSIDRMELDVSSETIDLRTPNYRLKLPLCQPIDPDRGRANWNDNEKILRITLHMKREYDFINF